MQSTPGKHGAVSDPAGAPMRPWKRRLVWAGGILAGLSAAGYLCTTSLVLRPIVRGRLEALLGGDVSMSSATLSSRGDLVVRNLEVTARRVTGPAGRILDAREFRARVGVSDLLRGRVTLTGLTLIGPVVRLSQSTEDARLNVQDLSPSSSSAAPASLPAIAVEQGAIEFGEHGASTFTQLFRLPVSGKAEPTAADPRSYAISFEGAPGTGEQGEGGGGRPTVLEGEINPLRRVGRLKLSRIRLSDWGTQWQASGVRSQWRALDIEGSIASAEFVLPESGGPYAEFALQGVGVTLPFQRQDGEAADGRRLRMSDVTGAVRFDVAGLKATLTGLIEDLRYKVSLTTEGLALDAPFSMTVSTAEPFLVEKHPTLLPFAPPVVRMRFATFSGPTAMVDAEVKVSRGPKPDSGDAPTRVAGLLSFKNGAARYDRFPYPVYQMNGLVRFSDEEIKIESIVGVNPRSGAKVHCDGLIRPPNEGAEVELNITFVDVPLTDAEFEAAIPEERRPVVAALFNREAYEALAAEGLVQPRAERAAAQELAGALSGRLALAKSEGRAALEAEAAEAAGRAAIPGFEIGGTALVDVHVQRELGDASVWRTHVRVRSPEVGLLSPVFPYPMVAKNFTIEIDDQQATAEAPTLSGLTGADGLMSARVRLVDETGRKVLEPRVIVSARGAPIDRSLLRALPSGAGLQGASPRGLLEALDLRGTLACVANVAMSQGAGDTVAYDVNVDLAGLTAFQSAASAGETPAPAPLLSDITGHVRLADGRVDIEQLVGKLNRENGDPAGEFAVTVRGGGADDGAAGLTATIDVTNLDLAAPIERPARAFSPSAAEIMKGLRERASPVGVLDARIGVSQAGSGPASLSAEIGGLRDISFDVGAERVSLADVEGSLVVTTDRVSFREFGATARSGLRDEVRLGLTGDLAFDAESPADPASLSATVTGLRLDSGLVRDAARRAGWGAAGGARAMLARGEIGGVVDANLRARRGADGYAVSGEAMPRSLVVRRGGREVAFPHASGRVVFDAEGAGAVEGLRLWGGPVRAEAEGIFRGSPGVARIKVTGEADSLNDDVLALMPEDATSLLRRLDVSVAGPVRLRRGEVIVSESWATVSGALAYENAGFSAGVPFGGASGEIRLDVLAVEEAARFVVDVRADEMTTAGLRLANARARLRSGETPGETLIEHVEAEAYGGRIAGGGRVQAGGSADGGAPGGEGIRGGGTLAGPDRAERFEAMLVASGVRFGEVMADLGSRWGAEPEVARGTARLDASLSVAGSLADSSMRFGRGHLRVHGGEVLRLPLLTRLVEASNLRLPSGDALNAAEARFFLDGDLVRFEELSVASDNIRISGEGAMRYPSLDLDLTFNSRGTTRVPLFSDLFEALRNEMATLRVTGPLSAPSVGVEQLVGTRRILGGLFEDAQPRAVRPERPSRAATEPP